MTHSEDVLVAQMVKNLPVTQETRVRSLGWEVPLEKGMVIHSSILAWRIPGIEKSGGLQSVGSQRVRHDWAPSLSLFTFLLQRMKVKSESEVAQLCPTLSDPMDCRLTGSSIHGIFQARVLEWGANVNLGKVLEMVSDREAWHAAVHGVTKSQT